jgi:hypothetical protein
VRDFVFKAAFVLLLVVLVFGAWLTQNPDAAVLERATRWPLVGGVVERFREAYLPGLEGAAEVGSEEEAAATAEPEIVYVEGPGLAAEDPDELLGARPVVWVQEGTPLKASPDAEAAEVARTEGIANLRVYERRGDWFDVGYRRQRGWVYLEGYEESDEPPLGSDPLPPGPLLARRPEPERVEFARGLLGGGESATRLGLYTAYTDADRPELLALLERVIGGLEEVYSRRYGVVPIGEGEGVLVLFASHRDFATYRDRELSVPGVTATGLAGGGLVALDLAGRSDDEVAATAVHELTHLLNRRALGPALPAWLEEGLADDLAQSEIDPDGSVVTERLGGVSIRRFDGWEWRGAQASILALRKAVDEGSLRPLEELMRLDWQAFVAEEPERPNYAQASFWLRFLLQDSELGRGLRAFLAGVAAGESAEGEQLRLHLGRDWHTLNADFHSWIRLRFHDPRSASRRGES